MKRLSLFVSALAMAAALALCFTGCGGNNLSKNMVVDGIYSDITGIYDAKNMDVSKEQLLATQGDAKDVGYFVFVTINPDEKEEQIGQDATATLTIGGNKYNDDYKVNQSALDRVFKDSKYDSSRALTQWPVKVGGNPAYIVFYFQGIVDGDLDKEATLNWGSYTAKLSMSKVNSSCETPSDIVAVVG